MRPAIEAGDIVVTRLVRPSEVEVGDVVTFRDPTRSNELVTHRVLEAERRGDRSSFVTRGDANTGVEQWTVEADGTVGSLRFRIPKLGYAFAWVGDPRMRAWLLLGGSLLLGAALLQRIWRDEEPLGGHLG